MKVLLLLVIVGGVFSSPAGKYRRNNLKEDPEETMTAPEIIQYHGYPVQIHHVTTSDGYILELHRIPNNKAGDASKGPIFIQHGIFSSSADWVINPAETSLGFVLSDAGYDVWLGNFRGNTYSRKHTSLNPDTDKEFWQFSWDDMAEKDLPAEIDYVLEQTGKEKLPYIGYSMGTSTMFALLSENPVINSKITTFYALAPVTYMAHAKGPMEFLGQFAGMDEWFLNMLGSTGELLPSDEFMKLVGDLFCSGAPTAICENLLFLFLGYDEAQTNATRLPVYIAHSPAGTSVNTVVHYVQEISNSGKYQKYDFGDGNMEIYGQTTPPEYDVSKITTPVVILHSDNDYLADTDDVAQLALNLKSLKSKYRINWDEFTHLDFQWALQSKELVYDKLLEYLQIFG